MIIVISFLVYMFLEYQYFDNFYTTLKGNIKQPIISYIVVSLIVSTPIVLGTFQLKNNIPFIKNIGLQGNFITGLCFGLVASLPLLIGYSLYFPIDKNLYKNIIFLIISLFFYEIYYRGFFFQQLFKNTRLGFLPIILINISIIFIVHLLCYKWSGFTTYKDFLLIISLDIINILSLSFLEIALFSWLYIEWNFNFWIVFFAHFFISLQQRIFISPTEIIDGVYGLIFYAISITLMILITYFYKKKKKIPFKINKGTFWVQK